MSSFSCRLWRVCDSEMISLICRRTVQISKTDHRNEAPGVCLMTLFLCDICFSAILYANELGRRRHLVSSSPSNQICFDNIDCAYRETIIAFTCSSSGIGTILWCFTADWLGWPGNQQRTVLRSCKTNTVQGGAVIGQMERISLLSKSFAVLLFYLRTQHCLHIGRT